MGFEAGEVEGAGTTQLNSYNMTSIMCEGCRTFDISGVPTCKNQNLAR